MRLVGRILFVAALATVPAVVAPIGCAVDSDRYPGLPNSLPNSPVGGGPTPGSSSSSSGSASSSSGGTVVDLCTCTAGFLVTGACSDCGGNSVAGANTCSGQNNACINDTACQAALMTCLPTCSTAADVAACIAGCIKSSAIYEALVTCQCGACQAQCQSQPPLACNLGGTGGGGTGGSGTGGGGTGGAAADAGDGG